MAFISETLQMRRLTESGVNIKTTYIVDGTLRYRSTDGTCHRMTCTVVSAAAKSISGREKLLHTEKIFDSRMEYDKVGSAEIKRTAEDPSGRQCLLSDQSFLGRFAADIEISLYFVRPFSVPRIRYGRGKMHRP